jgi:hypothetical protein
MSSNVVAYGVKRRDSDSTHISGRFEITAARRDSSRLGCVFYKRITQSYLSSIGLGGELIIMNSCIW